ncbi:uncharacterized protein LOC114552173 [Perca flavescens]|uniref:uncharacterized protein LOC114552173 n=1 Tax=Perca flavescens TaxID=8167 RepID=UPI00106ECB28|nr:uncharacterized protein LOC114552173 [Perca flavescens]
MLGLASGRYGGRLRCPDVKCHGFTFLRLDCHLVNVHNMAKEARTAVLLSQRKVAVNERLLKIKIEKKEIQLIQQLLLSIGEELHEAGKEEAGPSVRGEAASVATPQPPQVAGSPPTAGSPSPAGCPPPYPSEGCSSRLAQVYPQDDLELGFDASERRVHGVLWDVPSIFIGCLCLHINGPATQQLQSRRRLDAEERSRRGKQLVLIILWIAETATPIDRSISGIFTV